MIESAAQKPCAAIWVPWVMSELFRHATVESLAGPWKGSIKIGPFGSQLKREDMVPSGHKVYGQENVISGDWSAGDRRVSDAKYNSLRSCELAPGDVVLSMMGTVGKCAIFPQHAEPGLMDSHLLRIQPNPQLVTPEYLATVLQAENVVGRQVAAMSHGSIMAGLSSSIVRRFSVPLPPLTEQPALSAIFDTLDTTIRQTEAIIEKLKQVKQGLLHDLLTRGIDANGELRPSPKVAPHLYQQSLLGPIPLGWSVLGLDDMAQSTRVVLRTGPFGSSLKGEHLTASGRPVVTIGSLGVGRFLEDALLYVSETTAQALAEYELMPGDIAFSRVADVGRSVVIEDAQRGWIMSSNFMRISVDATKVLPELLQSALAFDARVKRQVRSTVNSAGRDVASSAILMSLRFAVPTLAEQAAIIDRMKVAEARIAREESYLSKLGQTKSGLMDDLLTGRVRVTSLLDAATTA